MILTNFYKLCKVSTQFYRFSSSYCKISDIYLRGEIPGKVVVRGWIQNIKKLKTTIFVDINDGTIHKNLQVVIPKTTDNNLTFGSSVEVSGILQENPSGQIELIPDSFLVPGECSLDSGYPFAQKKSYSDDYLRQYLHLRNRTSKFNSLLRLRHRFRTAINDHYFKHGYVQIDAPILTSNDCEGGGEVFKVLPDNPSLINLKEVKDEDYFDVKTYLSVSGQMHLEATVRSLSQVYCFGPTFRAENSKSRLHLSEFYMIEAESAFFTNTEDLVLSVELLIKELANVMILECREDILNYNKFNEEQRNISLENIEKILENKFSIITYKEAGDILDAHQSELKVKFKSEIGLTKEHELFLVKHFSNVPVFVVDWPAELKPFYMRQLPGSQSTVQAFDLLCPVVGEVCGGSMREDNYDLLKEKLAKADLSKKLDWYLQLRQFGNVLTGGYGIGFERLIQIFLGIPNIKDTIPYPRWPHNCKM